jgi:AAA15 family ATPase/GTPase
MIESIKIKNFLSFKDEQEISFVASREVSLNHGDQESWYTEIDGTRLLKMLVFIGNNGAGKTNALSAISYLRHIAVNCYSDPEDKPTYKPFLLDDDSRKHPTEITMFYYIGDERFSYRVVLDADYIIEESLIRHNGRNTASVYKRSFIDGRTVINFGNSCDLNNEDKKSLVVNTLNNTTVLASFGSKNLYSQVLRKHYLYFRRGIRMVNSTDFDPMELVEDNEALNQPAIKEVIISLLHSVDTKINNYTLTEHVFDIPKEFLDDAPKSIVEQIRKSSTDGKIHKWEMNFYHQTSHGTYPIDVDMESKGTVSMIRMVLLILDMIKNERCTLIDEFNYSIHQMSMNLLLRIYIALTSRSQLIITTQTIALLLNKRLRRDIIRICKKNDDGETQIVKINQSKVHKNNNLYKVYVDNELDGLPFVEDDFDFDTFINGVKTVID